jgi:SpoVK/Ycf46/Vps4 family AAA+-type ATPase
MHESVGNVGRVYDAARELYRASMSQKPVVLVLDEFDGWFERDENGGTHADVDVKQMETVLLQILDGMGDYNGIITMAMTNKPSVIPKGIIRRFRYVDIVGQLTEKERADMLKMYVEKTLPIREGEMTPEHYTAWAKKLENAPGDVVRKVVDEIHFSLLPEYIRTHPREAARLEGVLRRREISQGELKEGDINYLKARLGRDFVVTPEKVDGTIDYLLKQPPIRMQIDTARKLYREAEELLAEISTGSPAFGLQRRREIFR